jgi:DNA-binding MarR family transcriptional regulator
MHVVQNTLQETNVHQAPRLRGMDRSSLFPDPDMVGTLVSLSKAVRALTGLKLASIGIHPGQDQLVLALMDGEMTVSQLASQAGVRASTISKMVDRLVRNGYVEKRSAREDARCTWIKLTDTGVSLASRIEDVRASIEEELSGAMDGDTLKSIMSALVTLDGVVHGRLARLR